jgi:hypothetical protein
MPTEVVVPQSPITALGTIGAGEPGTHSEEGKVLACLVGSRFAWLRNQRRRCRE